MASKVFAVAVVAAAVVRLSRNWTQTQEAREEHEQVGVEIGWQLALEGRR